MTRPRVLLLLRIAVTAFALAALFSIYWPGDVLPLVASVGVTACILAILLYAACIVVSAIKWSWVLPAPPFPTLLHAVLASCFYALLPSGQLGAELGKALIVKARQPDAQDVIASILFDKITGVLGLLLIGVAAFALTSGRSAAWQIVLIATLSLLCICALVFAQQLARLSGRLPLRTATLVRLREACVGLLMAVDRFGRDRALLLRCIVLGIVSQCTVIAIYIVFAIAMQIQVGVFDLVGLVVIANLAALLPISLGGFGVREAGLTALLTQYHDVPGEQALALSLTAMSIFLLAAVVGGGVELRALLPRRALD